MLIAKGAQCQCQVVRSAWCCGLQRVGSSSCHGCCLQTRSTTTANDAWSLSPTFPRGMSSVCRCHGSQAQAASAASSPELLMSSRPMDSCGQRGFQIVSSTPRSSCLFCRPRSQWCTLVPQWNIQQWAWPITAGVLCWSVAQWDDVETVRWWRPAQNESSDGLARSENGSEFQSSNPITTIDNGVR